jgi:hypothetical protein
MQRIYKSEKVILYFTVLTNVKVCPMVSYWTPDRKVQRLQIQDGILPHSAPEVKPKRSKYEEHYIYMHLMHLIWFGVDIKLHVFSVRCQG